MNKLEKLGLMMQIGGIIGLGVIASKAVRERHKAKCERHEAVQKMLDTEILNCKLEMQNATYETIIRRLEKELTELKGENEKA